MTNVITLRKAPETSRCTSYAFAAGSAKTCNHVTRMITLGKAPWTILRWCQLSQITWSCPEEGHTPAMQEPDWYSTEDG